MHVLEGMYGSDKYDLAILDRGIFDALAWFELLKTRGEISEKECANIHDFLRIGEWRSAIDAVIMFQADPDTSLERENQHKLIIETGSAMNPEILGQLNKAYDIVKTQYSHEFSRFEDIDTSRSKNTTPKSNAEYTTQLILDIFESKLAMEAPS